MMKKRKKKKLVVWQRNCEGNNRNKILANGRVNEIQNKIEAKTHCPVQDVQKEAQGPDAGGLLEDFVARGRVSLLSASILRIGGEA